MSIHLCEEDRAALERLLSQIAGRLDGAIDFWTVVCLSEALPRRAFIERHATNLQAAVAEVEAILRRSQADVGPVRGLLSELVGGCTKLRDAFLILAQHETLPQEAVRLATTALTEVYDDLRQAIREIGQAANVSVGYLENRTAEAQSHLCRILDGLYEQFRQQRETAPQQPVPSGTT